MILSVVKHGLQIDFVSQSINDPDPVDLRDGTVLIELAYLQDANLLQTDAVVVRFESEEFDSYGVDFSSVAAATHVKIIGITSYNRIGSNRVRAQVTDQIGSAPPGTIYDVAIEPGEMVAWRDGVLRKYLATGEQALDPAVAGSGGGGTTTPSVLSIPFHSAADSQLALTNQVQAANFLSASNRNITLLDLAGYTECRVVARVVTGSASVNTPQVRVVYSTTFTTTVGSFSDIGTSPVVASMTTAGVARSAWVPLATNAAADAVYVSVLQEGGDTVADPVIGMLTVEFR